jgi:RNA polymerase sigma-70 factor (ECF subfamily)
MHELIQLSQAGHRDARRLLVSQLNPRVRSLARYYAFRSANEAEDLEQEIWIGVLSALQEVDLTIGDPVAYLMKHGRWRALEAVKRRHRHREEALESTETVDPQSGPESLAIGSALLDHLRLRLSPAQQAVLEGRIAGLSGEEMAENIGCTPANVSYHLKRIREELHSLLAA